MIDAVRCVAPKHAKHVGAAVLVAYGIIASGPLKGAGILYLVSLLALIAALPLALLEIAGLKALGIDIPGSMTALNAALALALLWIAFSRPARSPAGIAATILLTLVGMIWISTAMSPRIGP